MPSAVKPAIALPSGCGGMKKPATMGGFGGGYGRWSVTKVDRFAVDAAAGNFVSSPFTAGTAAVSDRHLAGRVPGDAGDGHGARHLVRYPRDLSGGHESS